MLFSFSYNKDNHSAKVPMALTHLWWFEGNLSSSTLRLDHPWSLIPGHSPRPPSSCHSPWAAKAAQMFFHLSTVAPGRVVGKSQVRGSGNGMRSNERMGWTKERAGGRRPPLLCVALSRAHPSFSSLLSLSSGPVKGRASSFLLHTLKSIGYRGVLNLKLCKPCQISVHN